MINFLFVLILSAVINMPLLDAKNCSYVTFSENDITMKSETVYSITATASNVQCYSSVLKFIVQHSNVVEICPKYLIIDRNATYDVKIKAMAAGKSEIKASYFCLEKFSDTFIRISVFHSSTIEIFTYVTGWLYLIMWSTANCPQILKNYKRKSIAGLSIDYIILHTLGHIYYSIFNVAFYYVPVIKRQYALRFPKSAKPVVFSDMAYSIIVTIMALVMLIQAFIYGLGEQRPSKFLKTFLVFCGCVKLISITLIYRDVLEWLDFIYICSYIKLAISVKYVPQIVTNCKRQSTEGFSMTQVFLDLCGGLLSIMHMVFIAYNYNDWPLFFENCTKFGLGLLSACFDFIFIMQHYVLFKKTDFPATGDSVAVVLATTTL